MKKQELKNRIEIRNLETFRGHDGMIGTNCDIVFDGRKIAHAYDDAWGGPWSIDALGKYGTDELIENEILLEELESLIDTLPKEKTDYGMMKINIDIFIAEMCDDLYHKKQFDRMSKKWILFKTADGSEMKYGWNGNSLKQVVNDFHGGLSAIQNVVDQKIKQKCEIQNKEYLKKLGVKF